MKLTPQQIQLGSLLIGPIAALAGVWLSPRLTSKLEQDRWLRERRMGAYRNTIRAAQSLIMITAQEDARVEVLQWVKETFPNYKEMDSKEVPKEDVEPIIAKRLTERFAYYTPLLDAISEVTLYGSEAAYLAVDELYNAVFDITGKGQEGADKANLAIARLILACREELGLKAAHNFTYPSSAGGSPRTASPAERDGSRRRWVIASSFSPAVPPACHKQRSRAVSSGQPRSLGESR